MGGTTEQKRRWRAEHPGRSAEASRRYVARHPERAAAQLHRAQVVRIAAWRAMTDELKAAGCADCGTTAVRLHFHHLDPSTKSFSISDGWAKPTAVREAEIAKCVVVCEPCHKARHRVLAEEEA